MKSPAAPARRPVAGIYFRSEIEKAEATGVSRDDMVLRLTLSDVSQLRRDRSLAVADISFANGVMRFLGVEIVQGGVPVSVLSHPGTESATPA